MQLSMRSSLVWRRMVCWMLNSIVTTPISFALVAVRRCDRRSRNQECSLKIKLRDFSHFHKVCLCVVYCQRFYFHHLTFSFFLSCLSAAITSRLATLTSLITAVQQRIQSIFDFVRSHLPPPLGPGISDPDFKQCAKDVTTAQEDLYRFQLGQTFALFLPASALFILSSDLFFYFLSLTCVDNA